MWLIATTDPEAARKINERREEGAYAVVCDQETLRSLMHMEVVSFVLARPTGDEDGALLMERSTLRYASKKLDELVCAAHREEAKERAA